MRKTIAKKGFTLLELCMVLALLGILAGIGVVSYRGLKTGAADRTAEKQLYNIQSAFLHSKSMAETGGIITSDTFTVTLPDSSGELVAGYLEGKMEEELPQMEGTYTIEAKSASGVFTYTITYHANDKTYTLSQDGKINVSSGSLANPDYIDRIMAIMKEEKTQLDSNAVEAYSWCHTTAAVNQMNSEGIDMSMLGAVTWHCDRNGAMLYWTTLDIHDYSSGTQVPVMRYNPSDKTYTVYTALVLYQQIDKDHPTYYKVLGSFTQYTPSTVSDAGNQTYTQAKIRYNELMKKYGYA